MNWISHIPNKMYEIDLKNISAITSPDDEMNESWG
eukprot:CAMPEP_0197019182 /NCGR_PEP_ID=MMETSP1380-20130617/80549_1 /TAXON_ID=5936 /ORGANISM="Euplotes crassus, Strain CT5" /LENGTH=34 /DNA_ID= /DNA_START= /DNA_END= /DNA_ORIENTATION=